MLLRRMADFQAELVAAACEELGASHARYMAAHNRWQSMLHSRRAPRGLDLYRAVLGAPEAQRALEFGDATATACWWPLPDLWPDLRWEVIVGVGGVALGGALVRPPGAAVPVLPGPDHLAPWSCVVGDVSARFAAARHRDPQVPSRWLMELDGYELWFVHGLLQTARPSTVDGPGFAV